MTRLPPALAPLRHTAYRRLWSASLVTSLGLWLQNTGAGWLMTSLAPVPIVVALVQVATILPTFLLALPGGALADIVDRRRFLIGTQSWTMIAAAVLAAMTLLHQTTAVSLLIFTFVIGVGSALTQPAWSAIVPDLVPRGDLVQAISLGGIGFNLARAVGPALAGFLLLIGGAGLTFSLYAVSFLAVLWALWVWRGKRRSQAVALPREHLLSAMRAGSRFVAGTPAVRAAMLRCFVFAFPASAPWALLPLVVREQLHLGPGMFGLILGLMGAGGVAAGLTLPLLANRLGRGDMVFVATLASCAGMALVGLARHWAVAALGMALFGTGWVTAFAMTQAAAQLACPPWVRARALGIYQLSYNGALAVGSLFWGWLGTFAGLPHSLLAAAVLGTMLALPVRIFGLDTVAVRSRGATAATGPEPEAPAGELAPVLAQTRERVLEIVRYEVRPARRKEFLRAMREVRLVRRRTGAMGWRLYEDVAHPSTFMESWRVADWTEHMREHGRLSAEDLAILAGAAEHCLRKPEAASRFIAVDPAHDFAASPAPVDAAQPRTADWPLADANLRTRLASCSAPGGRTEI